MAHSSSDSVRQTEKEIRHFTAARIPPMTAEEIKDILDRRRNFFNIKFDPGNSVGSQDVLLRLTQVDRNGIAADELSDLLDVDEDALDDFVQANTDRIIIKIDDRNWRLTFSRLGAVIRGYDFLRKNSKDRYHKLLQT